MADVHVVDAVSVGLLVQEVKHVLDGQRQRGASTHGAEQRLEQVVHKLLQRALQETQAGELTLELKRPCYGEQNMSHLCGEQPGQVDLRHHLAAALALLLVPVVVVLDQVPNFDPALQVRGEHGHAGVGAVRAGRRGAEGHVHALVR